MKEAHHQRIIDGRLTHVGDQLFTYLKTFAMMGTRLRPPSLAEIAPNVFSRRVSLIHCWPDRMRLRSRGSLK